MAPRPVVRIAEGVPSGGEYTFRAHKDPATVLASAPNSEGYDADVALALEAARAYERTDSPIMSDTEFDALLARIGDHEELHGIEPEHDLHSSVGHGGAVGGDVVHPRPMLSLDKPGEDAVIDFAHEHPNALVEPKIDGLAMRIEYRDGKLTQCVRRGDGTTGEDVTDRMMEVDGLPASVDGGDFEVRGEIYLSDENLERANAIRALEGKNPFANARNGVAGMVNKQDDTYAGLLSFAAYGSDISEDADHTDQMEALSGLGFTTAASLLPASVTEAEDPMAAIAALGAERKGIGFLMDGAVVKLNTAAERAAAGEGSRAPKWAVAYKYPPVEEPTVIEDIEYNIGKTGRLSIRARMKPVEVDGAVLEYASLHNVGDLLRKDIRIGDHVSAYKANDIIPQAHLPRTDLRSADSKAWQPPASCPKCSGPFDKSTELWRCTNPECSVSGRIQYAASRDAGFDIEGLGGSIGDALIEADLVKDVSDLFGLSKDQLANLSTGKNEQGTDRRVGEKTATKLMAEIEKAKAQPLNRVITALSMRHTGRTFGRRLASEFGTMEALQAATVDQLANVEGIGAKKAAVIHESLKKNEPVISRMRSAGVNMGAPKPEKATGAKAPKLATKAGLPMNVVVTGSVKSEPSLAGLSRSGVQELIEANGGKASGSVSKNTSLLVCGEVGSSKWNKAKELGVPVVTPEEFAQMLKDGEA